MNFYYPDVGDLIFSDKNNLKFFYYVLSRKLDAHNAGISSNIYYDYELIHYPDGKIYDTFECFPPHEGSWLTGPLTMIIKRK